MKTKGVMVSVIFIIMAFCIMGCNQRAFEDEVLDVEQIEVTSDSIDETGKLLTATTANKKPNDPLGDNQSPQLTWEEVDGAVYYAVCMFDEDANWLHWLVMDLKEPGLEQGAYTSDQDYVGPYPPEGSGAHNYRIEVFALKRETDNVHLRLDKRQTYSEIVRYLNRSANGENNIIARGYVMGGYENS